MNLIKELFASKIPLQCDLGHAIILINYYLTIQPFFTLRKMIKLDIFSYLMFFIEHKQIKDLFIRIINPMDTSLNLNTELKNKLLDLFQERGIKDVIQNVLSSSDSLKTSCNKYLIFEQSERKIKISKFN